MRRKGPALFIGAARQPYAEGLAAAAAAAAAAATVSTSVAGRPTREARSSLVPLMNPCRTVDAIENSMAGWNGNSSSIVSIPALSSLKLMSRISTPSFSATSAAVMGSATSS